MPSTDMVGVLVQGERGCVYFTPAELRHWIKLSRILGVPWLRESWVNLKDPSAIARWASTYEVDADFVFALDHAMNLPPSYKDVLLEIYHQ